MAEKIRRVLHSKECMMTGDVSELAKREGKLYFDAFQGEKKNVRNTLVGGFFFLIHTFNLSRFTTCLLIACIRYSNTNIYFCEGD